MRTFLLAAAALLAVGPAIAQQPPQQGTQEGACQEGTASYFRAGEGGNTRTATGEPVNPQDSTAASRDLPLGTEARVTDQQTGRSTDVRVNDRGPERTDRVIDLSQRAARDLGMERRGAAPVRIEADPARQPDPAAREQLERQRRPC